MFGGVGTVVSVYGPIPGDASFSVSGSAAVLPIVNTGTLAAFVMPSVAPALHTVGLVSGGVMTPIPDFLVTIPASTFTGGKPIAFANLSLFVATGDFNDDGISDVFQPDSHHDLNIEQGAGNGVFAPMATPGLELTGSLTPSAAAVVDFAKSGFADVVVAATNGTVTLFDNTAGTFTTVDLGSAGAGITALIAGDLNLDGVPDLVAVNGNGANVYLTPSGFDGGTWVNTAAAPGPGLQAVTIADVNGDGLPDIVFVSPDVTGIQAVLAQPGGVFGPGYVPLTGGPSFQAVAAGDLLGRGRQDLVGATSTGVQVFLGPDAGWNSAVAGTTISSDANPSMIVVADFDGDGLPDIATSDPGTSTIPSTFTTWVRNLGGGNFAPAVRVRTGAEPSFLATADVNLDGRMDLVVGNASEGAVSTLLNQPPVVVWSCLPGAGSAESVFLAGGARFSSGDVPTIGGRDAQPAKYLSPSALLGEVNIGGHGSFPVGVDGGGLSPAADGVGTVPTHFTVFRPESSWASDGGSWGTNGQGGVMRVDYLTGGAGADVVEAVNSGAVLVWEWDPQTQGPNTTPLFLGMPGGTSSPGPVDIALFDVNHDGLEDITCLDGADRVVTFLNFGDGGFGDGGVLGSVANANAYAMAAADLDGDGMIDIATVSEGGGGGVYVFYGSADGTFSAPQQVSAYARGVDIAVGDYNADGLPDLFIGAVGNSSNPSLVQFENMGNGSFSQVGTLNDGDYYKVVRVGYFNTTDPLNWPILYIMAGDSVGNINFFEVGQPGFTSIQAGGVQSDNNDIAMLATGLSSASGAPVTVLTNNSGGPTVLVPMASASGYTSMSLPGSPAESVAIGDVTGDGRADILAHTTSSQGFVVYPGQ